MDKTDVVIGYLKTFPNTYGEFIQTMSKWYKIEVKEEHLLKLKIESLIYYLVPFVETNGGDILDALFYANYQKPNYTFHQLQVHAILLIFDKLEKNQPLIFLVF